MHRYQTTNLLLAAFLAISSLVSQTPDVHFHVHHPPEQAKTAGTLQTIDEHRCNDHKNHPPLHQSHTCQYCIRLISSLSAPALLQDKSADISHTDSIIDRAEDNITSAAEYTNTAPRSPPHI